MRIKRMLTVLAIACTLLVGTVTVFADEEEVVILDEPATTESAVTTVKEAETVPVTTYATTVTVPETESVTTEPVITIISGNVDIVTDSAETEEAEETKSENSFSVEGNGEVLDDITDDSEMEFLTITTANGNTFYLIIDRSSDNVYMLSTIDEYDLQDFIEDDIEETDTTTSTSQGSVVLEEKTESTEEETETETPAVTVDEESSGSMSVIIIVLIIAVAVGGGAYFYLKVYKPKHEADNYKSENMEIGDGLETINEDEVKESDGSHSEE